VNKTKNILEDYWNNAVAGTTGLFRVF